MASTEKTDEKTDGTARLIVLDPTVASRDMEQAMAPASHGLGRQSVGFLWSSKPTASIPAPGPVIDELAESIQAVIVGLAD